MKKEIKEILDKLKDGDWYEEKDLTGMKWIELEKKETKILLDYITNLQEGNKNLLEEVENIQNQNNKSIDIINELENFAQDEYRNPSENEIEWEVGLFVDKINELKENK